MVGKVETHDIYKLIEVVDGDWLNVDRFSMWRGVISANVLFLLMQQLKNADLGQVYPAGLTYVLEGTRENIRTMRKASVTFVAKDRIVRGWEYYYQAPDLAVEIVLDHDSQSYYDNKIADWLRSGTKQVWVIYPEAKQVEIYLPDGTSKTYKENDMISGGEVLPEFSIKVAEIIDV